jgi:hypothetical protein
MDIQRKLQLGAAGVILNGILVLSALYPGIAEAACQTSLAGCTLSTSCPLNPTAFCEALQPGCTVTQHFCEIAIGVCPYPPYYTYACSYS